MIIPEIEQINGTWRGKISLNSWNNFFGDNLVIELNIGGDKTVNNLEIKHKEAYEYILHHQSELLEKILLSLLSEYSNMQDEYGYDDDEIEKYMPSVNCIHDFSKLMLPKRIYILDIEKDNLSYIGFSFSCSWDVGRILRTFKIKKNVEVTDNGKIII
ncbi:MAG: hypothetical protein II838_13470 [Lachnospiraceae bacterium]|nr:hypothetical protein [Lachnospiraceae bacterium]